MKSEELNYKIDEQNYRSFVAYPDGSNAPLILIVHTWAGRDKFVEEKAKKLASAGYVAMAATFAGSTPSSFWPSSSAPLIIFFNLSLFSTSGVINA